MLHLDEFAWFRRVTPKFRSAQSGSCLVLSRSPRSIPCATATLSTPQNCASVPDRRWSVSSCIQIRWICRIALRRRVFNTTPMSAHAYIAARVPSDTKAKFAVVARHYGVSESVLLRRLVEGALMTSVAVNTLQPEPVEPVAASGKISIRLRTDDLLLLRERAKARQMPTATYVSLLIRSHLRNLSPLPTQELEALQRSIAEVGAVGRNLNQIARSLNRAEGSAGPTKADLQVLVRALSALRDQTKSLVTANVTSWELGYEEASH